MTTERGTQGKGPPSAITLAASIVTHILLLLPVVYIVVLAFVHYQFFSWHPICMSIAVGLLISEAVFSISGEAYLSYRLPRRYRVTVHWILNSLGLGFLAIGFIIIVVNKVNQEKSHFVTTHSQLGLTTLIITALVSAFGILANNTNWLYPKVRPVLIKVSHAFAGIFLTILLLATLINGTYTRWWPGGEVGRDLTFASLFFAGLFILIKPILGAVSRTKVILNPPSSQT
ncbi:transmembrane reductase CYB561D2-like [Prorops nasuta]|uniref:transmembrane reductase CYB561D2-like n=1 Tax=Prorops nasuta TaxID=863751 RepID=UPI0034CF1FC7